MSNTTRKPHPIYLFVQCDNGDGSAWLPIHNKNKELVAKVIVSEIDWKWLMQHKFYLEKNGYARTRIGKSRIYIHRLIMKPENEMVVDHINRNRLDNRRENLRIITLAENAQNKPFRNGRGVSYIPSSNKYQSQAKQNGKQIRLGLYETREEAAKVAAEWRKNNMPFSEN